MSFHLYDISFFNLCSIHEKDGQSFRKEDFKNPNGTALANQNELIDFLLTNDLIEFEEDEKRYFLTTETYVLIEDAILEDFLWNVLGEEERDRYHQVKKEKDKRTLKYRIIEPDKAPEKKPYLSNVSKPLIITIFAAIIALIYAIIPYENKWPEEKGLSPEEIEGLNRIIMINEEGDTLNLDEKQLKLSH